MTFADFPRIAADPAICGGRPVLRGTRIRVTDVLAMLAGGACEAEITADFPYVTAEDVCECLAFGVRQAPDYSSEVFSTSMVQPMAQSPEL